MDNQMDNNYYGLEPQKPITEKQFPETPDGSQAPPVPPVASVPPVPPTPSAPQVASVPPVPQTPAAFEPQRPLMQPVTPPQDSFDPVQHRAVFEDNRFRQPQQPVAPPSPQPVTQPVSQPVTPEKKPAKKPNAALLVIIILMGVLLVGAMFGLYAYTLYYSQNTSQRDTKKIAQQSGEQAEPSTGGNGGRFLFPDDPSPSQPSKEHKESDYSDKVDKNYSGMTLADKPDDAQTNSRYSAEYAFQTASDSVVSVLCYADELGDVKNADSQGSGIVLSGDGYVVTNAHVVNNSKTAYAIKVVTADGKEYKAGVVGFDSRTDLAVLKLDGAKDLKPAVFGDSEKLVLGEDMIIIGNPGGMAFQNSMSKGIVSALDRDASAKSLVKFIQTDAAINPGNSGGPAVNNYGQVVGIATAKIADEKYEGMGFCIPSAQVKVIVDSLMKNGYVAGRVKIGITGTAVSAAYVQMYDMPHGIFVDSIAKGGPCDGCGLEKDDIITALDDHPITSFSDIYSILENYKEGDEVTLKVRRIGDDQNEELEFKIKLQADK